MKQESFLNQYPNLSLAASMAALLRERYCGEHGLLVQKVDTSQGKILNPRPIIDELGDYVQYTLVLGNLIGDEGLCAWSKAQVMTALKISQSDVGFIHSLAIQPGLRGCFHRTIYFQLATCDTLWGLVECFRLWPDPTLRTRIERFVEGVLRFGTGKKHLPVYGVFRWHGISLPLPLSNPMLVGYWIESLIMLYEILKNDQYLTAATEMAYALVKGAGFQGSGFFPLRIGTHFLDETLHPLFDLVLRWRGRLPSAGSIMVKGNVYFIFGLLALYRMTSESWIREAIIRWKRCVLERLRTLDGRFYNHWYGINRPPKVISLGTNHSFIELFLDIFYDMRDEEALQMACQTARAWLTKRSKIGLIPDGDYTPIAFLDPHIDFTINLMKLWQITGDPFWRETTEEMERAVEKYYHQPFGLAWELDTETGKIVHSEIETKFLGLFLKLPLLLYFATHKGELMSDANLRKLATDR